MPSVRNLRPRAPVTAAPSHVSQLNCLALVGVDPERFLALLRDNPDVPRAAVGKLRVVAVEDLRALLARLSAGQSADPRACDVSDETEPTTADEVLGRLGLRRSA